MIAVDTNVLVRLVIADDPAQTDRAGALLARAREEDAPLYVTDIVLCEVAWVLARTYGFSRALVAEALQGIVDSPELLFRDVTTVTHAIGAHARGDGGFADHLIAATARAAGCEAVATFDEKLLKLPGFVAP